MWPKIDHFDTLTDHQMQTINQATKKRLALLLGTPGTGKTWTAAHIIKQTISDHGINQVAVAAPTGKAALRITENLNKHGLSITATTIHRLLGVSRGGQDGKGWGFTYDSINPLPQRYIFIDEASMLDASLAAALFNALSHGSHIMLIGDPYQLPPVGHGAPLRDMISAGMSSGELTEVKRNDGKIVQICRDLKEGRPFIPCRDIALENGENVYHFETKHHIAALEKIIHTAPPEINVYRDIQTIVPINDKGECSRKTINEFVQRSINFNDNVPNTKFRIGDKVICTSNCEMPLWEFDHNVALYDKKNHEFFDYVANGDMGFIVAANDQFTLIELDAPRRTVRVVTQGKIGTRPIDQFDLGYAITCHKSQGSQWRCPVIIADDAAGFVASREWYYTGLSRAETLCFTIGKIQTINRQIKKVSLRDRKTFLSEQIRRII